MNAKSKDVEINAGIVHSFKFGDNNLNTGIKSKNDNP